MSWQDIAISIIVCSFSYALIPQIITGFKKKKGFINLQTSIITSFGMFGLSIIYFTMKLYFSSIIALITGFLWTTLFIQKIFYK
jgi:hypothetical protein